MAHKKAKIDGDTLEELSQLRVKLRLEPIPTQIWRGLLTEQERKSLGGGKFPPPGLTLTESYGRLRGHTPGRTLIELAKFVSLLNEADYRRLRAAIGEPEQPPPTVPHWDRHAGTLTFRGQTIRTVQGGAKNLRLILDAFQEAGWPQRIDNPLPGGKQSGKLSNTLKRMRETLQAIDFGGDGTATGIIWYETQRTRRTPKSVRK